MVQNIFIILLNIACYFVYNIDHDIVHIVHIARVLRYCTYCQYCTILLDIAHKIAQVWFADGHGLTGARRIQSMAAARATDSESESLAVHSGWPQLV